MEEYTQQQQRRRSILFVVAGLVFIGLVFLLIWFMKQRDQAYVDQGTPQTAQTEQAAPNNSNNQNSGTATPNNSPAEQTPPAAQSPATPAQPAPTQTTPQNPSSPQAHAEIPATGMTSNLLTVVVIMTLSYMSFRYLQSRRHFSVR